MTRHRPTAARLACAAVLAFLLSIRIVWPQSGQELRQRASDLTYNLDHDEAIALLREAIARDPGDSANYRALASTIWLNILFRRGAVTVDHYLGSFSRASIELKKPPADLDAEFKRALAQAIDLAEKRVAAAPKDAQAHYDLGTALGLRASYIASVEGRLVAGVNAARRSYDEQERVLALDPSRTDAGLIVGTYRYLVSTLSFPMRWMAYVTGFGGGKERGLRMIEQAAAGKGDDRTDAMFALVLLYNREQRYADALRILDELRRRYPRNRLVLLEAGATAIRGNRPAEAEAVLTEGIAMLARDTRARIPGELGLWHCKRGAARVLLKRREEALADLRIAAQPDSAGWVRGRAHLELARLAVQENKHEEARREAALAADECEKDHDPICADAAKRIVQ
jgi:tetratricopeptide (TPR) repeat protein